MTDTRDKYGHPVVEAEGSAVNQRIESSYNVNASLPWIVGATAASFLALGIAIGSIVLQQQGNKDVHDLAWKAETQCELYKAHVNDLEHTMAAHGIIPPPFKELK